MIAAPLLHQPAAIHGIDSGLIQMDQQLPGGEFGH
jgi:hypothetical protein